MLRFAKNLLRIANICNWFVGVIFLLLAATTFFAPDLYITNLSADMGGDKSKAWALVNWIRYGAGLTIFIVPLAHVALMQLIKMTDSVAAGDSFISDNALRLRRIAWALLGINIIDLGFGVISMWASEATGEYLGWSLSLTSWFAVLLLFILSRIFHEGAKMREELEGTV